MDKNQIDITFTIDTDFAALIVLKTSTDEK